MAATPHTLPFPELCSLIVTSDCPKQETQIHQGAVGLGQRGITVAVCYLCCCRLHRCLWERRQTAADGKRRHDSQKQGSYRQTV